MSVGSFRRHHGRVCTTIAALLAAVVLVTASCGLPTDETAREIEPEAVEFDLLSTTTSTTSTTLAARPNFTVTFYWHDAVDNRLVTVTRGRDAPADPAETLRELVVGPSNAELETDPELVTLLDDSMAPELTGPDENGVHGIVIQQIADEALSTDQVAEFVCTATQFEAVDAVVILDPEGNRFSLSGLGAVPLEGPATAADFGDCVTEPEPVSPEASSTTTTTEG